MHSCSFSLIAPTRFFRRAAELYFAQVTGPTAMINGKGTVYLVAPAGSRQQVCLCVCARTRFLAPRCLSFCLVFLSCCARSKHTGLSQCSTLFCGRDAGCEWTSAHRFCVFACTLDPCIYVCIYVAKKSQRVCSYLTSAHLQEKQKKVWQQSRQNRSAQWEREIWRAIGQLDAIMEAVWYWHSLCHTQTHTYTTAGPVLHHLYN